ncbi:MAG TPA: efflux RND transporter periplasmic adaptor subunit, partial [Sedimenticola sp.]|nr:efflux RND transporter periplasmic adaptor subunit [Sedimenticola sp.]
MPLPRNRLLPLLALLLLFAGCSPTPDAGNVSPPTKRPPPRAHLVELTPVRPERVSTALERSGTLKVRRSVRIHNQEEGRIIEAPFYEGDRVKKGTVLIRMEEDLLRAQLDKAAATARQARVDLSRLQNLVKKRAASKDEMVRAETALQVALAEQRLLQTRLSHTRIEAPFDGVVSERRVEPGDVVAKHSHLLTLIDPNSLVTEIRVSELLLPHLKPGDPVAVRIDALGSQTFPGRIRRIHPELDPVTRQGVVEVALDPVPPGARPGQFARVTLETAKVERMLVPFAAVKRDRKGTFVYRVDDEMKVHKAPVRTGIRTGSRIEIL